MKKELSLEVVDTVLYETFGDPEKIQEVLIEKGLPLWQAIEFKEAWTNNAFQIPELVETINRSEDLPTFERNYGKPAVF